MMPENCLLYLLLFLCIRAGFAVSSNATLCGLESNESIASLYLNNLEDVTFKSPVILSSPSRTHFPQFLLKWKFETDDIYASQLKDIQYIIRFKRDPSYLSKRDAQLDSWCYIMLPYNVSSYTLTDLVMSSVYKVQMIAHSDFGTSSLTSFTFRTLSSENNVAEETKFHFEIQIGLTKTSHSSVSVSWFPRSSGGFPITRYQLEMRVGKKKWTSLATFMSNITSYEVIGLDKGQLYKFKVIAYNSKNQSVSSKVETIELPSEQERTFHVQKLPAPRIIEIGCSNETSETLLEWEANKRHYVAEGYKIFYVETDDDETPTKQFIVSNPRTHKYSIKKTLTNTHFYVYMQAFSGNTLSPYSKRHYCPSKKIAMSSVMTVTPFSVDKDSNAVITSDTVSDRDKAVFIAGATFAFVALILAASGFCYKKALTNQLKQAECRDGSSKQFHSQICAKVAHHIKKTHLQVPSDPYLDQDFDNELSPCHQLPNGTEMGSLEEQYYLCTDQRITNNDLGHYQQEQHYSSMNFELPLEPHISQTSVYTSRGDDQHHCMATGMASLNWPGRMFGAAQTKFQASATKVTADDLVETNSEEENS